MALKATDANYGLGEVGVVVANITLFSVLIYELVGPFLTKIALEKAGEVDPEGKVSARHEHIKKMEEQALLESQATTTDKVNV